jgi:hypothetical protein
MPPFFHSTSASPRDFVPRPVSTTTFAAYAPVLLLDHLEDLPKLRHRHVILIPRRTICLIKR